MTVHAQPILALGGPAQYMVLPGASCLDQPGGAPKPLHATQPPGARDMVSLLCLEDFLVPSRCPALSQPLNLLPVLLGQS